MSSDPKTPADALARELKDSRAELGRLQVRMNRLETWAWNAGIATGLGALVVGMFLPFLMEKGSDDPESITLIPLVFGTAEDSSNGGPFSGEASFASVLLGLLALGTAVVAVSLLAVAGRNLTGRTLTTVRVLTGIYLVGAIGTWLFVLVFAGHDDDISAFSPATLAFSIGAVLAFGLCRSELADD